MKLLLVLASVAALVAGTLYDLTETVSTRAAAIDRRFPDLLRRNEVVVAILRDIYNALAQSVKTPDDFQERNFSFLAKFYLAFVRRISFQWEYDYDEIYNGVLNNTVTNHAEDPAYFNAASSLLFLDQLRVNLRKRSAALQELCYQASSNQECEDRLKEFDVLHEFACPNQAELHNLVLEHVYTFEAFTDDALYSKSKEFESLPEYLDDLRDRKTQKLVLTELFPKIYVAVLNPHKCVFGHYKWLLNQ